MFRWLLTIDALDSTGTARKLRFSDGRFTRDGKPYFPRISQPGLYRFGMNAGSLVSSRESGFGETVLINNDGGLEYLADYAIDGRQVVLDRVNNDRSITKVFSGTAMGFSFSGTDVVVRLRDPKEPLSEPHPHASYDGSNVLPNGLEGVEEDLKGTAKPQVFGTVLNIQAPTVNTARLIFEASSRSDCIITAVYDNGFALTNEGAATSVADLEGTAPTAGGFRHYNGYFRLGSSSVGVITCDANTSSDLAGDVMNMVCQDVGLSLSQADIDALNLVGSVGVYLEDSRPTADILDRLAISVGGFWRIDIDGGVVANVLGPPENATPVATVRPFMISEADRTATGSGDNGLPVWRVEMSVDHLQTTLDQVADGVSDARASRLRRENRKATVESSATKNRHLLSMPYEEESVMRSVSESEAVCQRLTDLLSVRRDLISMEIQVGKRWDVRVADAVDVEYPLFGYHSPRRMLVIGIELDAKDKVQRLELWG